MTTETYERGFVDKILGDIFYTTTPKTRDTIADVVNFDESTALLAVACRTGDTAFHFTKTYNCKSVGVDFFEANIKEAEKTARREKLTKMVTFIRSYAGDIPLDDNSFDVVVMERSLSCYDHKEEVVAECIRVLRPGGTFVMADFTVDDLDAADREDLKELTCLVTALPKQEYITIIESNGLSVESHDKKDLAEKKTKTLLLKWKKIRLFSNIFLKASAADSTRFEALMKKGEIAIKNRQLGYAIFIGTKPS